MGNVAQSTRLEWKASSPSDLETNHSEMWGDITNEDISFDLVGKWIWNKRCFRNRIVFILCIFFSYRFGLKIRRHTILSKNKSQCKNCKIILNWKPKKEINERFRVRIDRESILTLPICAKGPLIISDIYSKVPSQVWTQETEIRKMIGGFAAPPGPSGDPKIATDKHTGNSVGWHLTCNAGSGF